MNCEKFESVMTDTARGQLTEAGLREAATRHSQICPNCAARFAQQQNLSVALGALALLDENKKATPQTESNLLDAFRNRTKTASIPATAAGKQPQVVTRNHRAYWWVAAAAMVIIALALFALRAQNSPSVPQQEAHDNGVQPPAPDPQNAVRKPNNHVTPPQGVPVVNKKADALHRRNLIHQTAKLNSRLAKNGRRQKATGKPADEIATNFMPLHNIPMTEGGQVVRVELPRSALATFGFPVNATVADKPVKADVVIGNDGIARAIRFVQ